MKFQTGSHQRSFSLALIIIVSFLVIQCVFIDADTPVFLTDDPGAFCDEGYKILEARNFALFGERTWSKLDEYPGWYEKNPVAVYFTYAIFKFFGVSLKAARLGSVLFAVATLLLVFLIVHRIYGAPVSILILTIFPFHQAYFFYSRLALLEVKVMFFLLLGLYFLLLAGERRVCYFFAIFPWITAYFFKYSASFFFVSTILFVLLIRRDELILKKIFREKGVVILLVFLCVLTLFFEYLYITHGEPYTSLVFQGKHFRRPIVSILGAITHSFFAKNPLMSFFAILYCGHLILSIMSEDPFKKEDLFCAVWLITGVMLFSIFNYQPLRYFLYFAIPLAILSIQGIFAFPETVRALFMRNKTWIKCVIFVMGTYFLIIHTFFLPFIPVKVVNHWDVKAVYFFAGVSLFLLVLLGVLYRILIHRNGILLWIQGWNGKRFIPCAITAMFLINIAPVIWWSAKPKYELRAISENMKKIQDNKIFAGDWAPQLLIDSKKRVLYIDNDFRFNIHNLDKIKPDYLIFVEKINDSLFNVIKREYPEFLWDKPANTFSYGGRNIMFYGR